jgi:uncharacterized membrane protein
MNPTHLHLLTNHVSLFALVFGLIALVLGLIRKSEELKLGAAIIFLIGAIMIVPANQTGEEAEHTVEELAGVNHDDIEEHEHAAEWALYAMGVLGLLSIVALFQFRKRKLFPKGITYAMLVIAIWGFAVVARTAYLGGYIRHSEIHDRAPAGGEVHDDDRKVDDKKVDDKK